MKKKLKNQKYIFVVGGVISGVGKGVTSSSLGKILQDRGLSVTAIKIDPYINLDAGTMNPTEHGEVFVLDDGYETDQDMGNYERFLNTTLSRKNYMTTGVVYQEVIRRERNLEYGGKNVEVVPDIPLEVIRRIRQAGADAEADVVIIEIGGTIGEYQNLIFLEAGRMMKTKYPHDVLFVMVSYVPMPSKVGEMKTKPTQYASRTLNAAGIQADIIIARSELPLDQKRKDKIAVFCNVEPENIISAPDVSSIYEVPINFERDRVGDAMVRLLDLGGKKQADFTEWKKFFTKMRTSKKEVHIAMVGKYFDSGAFVLSDVYLSVIEALKFSACELGIKLKIEYLNSKDFETGTLKLAVLKKYNGVLVPGGFGKTGIEGKIKVIEYVRKNKIPYFGICYGMQLAVIEFARHVAGLKDANTREVNPTAEHIVIDIMSDQKEKVATGSYGGTMRLGGYPAVLKKGSIASNAYGQTTIRERHRHRYEVNPEYIAQLEQKGMIFSGKSPDGTLMEIAELPTAMHPFFVGVQFHPEFLARPLAPHKLFTAFIKAAGKNI